LKPIDIVDQTVSSYDLAERSLLQSTKHMKKMIRKVRNNVESAVFTHDFIPEMFLKTNNGDTFMQYISADNRICIFYSIKLFKILGNSNFAVGDETFKCSPNEFSQLYTFHAEIWGCVFPLIYIFLKDKSKKVYEDAFLILKSRGIFKENTNLYLILK
jgi:hypothetical protein